MNDDDMARVLLATDNLTQILLAIKAKGGYKYRDLIDKSNNDLDNFIARADNVMEQTIVSLVVAEGLIVNMGRGDYYRHRVREIMGELARLRTKGEREFRSKHHLPAAKENVHA